MPYMQSAILRANEVFARLDGFEPESLLEAIGEARGIRDGAESLGLLDVLEPDQADALRAFLDALPPGLDAAILAGLRSALERGVRTQFTWRPAYEFELRAWEVSEGSAGVLNMVISSPHPEEPTRQT